MFSAVSPLDGVELVISEAASSNQKETVLLVIDVRRAYFYAKEKCRGAVSTLNVPKETEWDQIVGSVSC